MLPQLTVIPIWGLVKRTTSEFKLAAKAKEIQLDLSCCPSPDDASFSQRERCADPELGIGPPSPGEVINGAKVIGDTMQITQVLRNFISNAVKFTPDKGTSSFVDCSTVVFIQIMLALTSVSYLALPALNFR